MPAGRSASDRVRRPAVFWAAGCRTPAAVSDDVARVLVHATAAVELILSVSIAGVVSAGPEDAADGFEAGQSHRLALIPANAVEAWASIAAAATSVARVSHGRFGWSGDLDDGWHAVGVISSTVIAWPMP
jgi:hypothetical protein